MIEITARYDDGSARQGRAEVGAVRWTVLCGACSVAFAYDPQRIARFKRRFRDARPAWNGKHWCLQASHEDVLAWAEDERERDEAWARAEARRIFEFEMAIEFEGLPEKCRVWRYQGEDRLHVAIGHLPEHGWMFRQKRDSVRRVLSPLGAVWDGRQFLLPGTAATVDGLLRIAPALRAVLHAPAKQDPASAGK